MDKPGKTSPLLRAEDRRAIYATAHSVMAGLVSKHANQPFDRREVVRLVAERHNLDVAVVGKNLDFSFLYLTAVLDRVASNAYRPGAAWSAAAGLPAEQVAIARKVEAPAEPAPAKPAKASKPAKGKATAAAEGAAPAKGKRGGKKAGVEAVTADVQATAQKLAAKRSAKSKAALTDAGLIAPAPATEQAGQA